MDQWLAATLQRSPGFESTMGKLSSFLGVVCFYIFKNLYVYCHRNIQCVATPAGGSAIV